MFNMPNQFIPNHYPINMNHNNELNILEIQINKLEKEIKKLENIISNLENKKEPYILTSQKEVEYNDDGMYMM